MVFVMQLDDIRPRPYGLNFVEATFYDKVRERKKAFRVSKDFVEKLFFGISKICTKYINDVSWDLPYIFTERTLDGVIVPVLSKLCDSIVLTELPTHRYSKKKNYLVEDSQGRIDYWCIYQNYTFVIEMKHGYDTFKPNDEDESLRKTVYDDWHIMNAQLISLTDEIRGYQEKTKGVIRLGLHFITSRKHKSPSKSLVNDFRRTDNIEQTMRSFSRIGQIYKSSYPDLAICWKIPFWMVETYEDVTYPGLWVIAKILDPEIHSGAKNS